MELKKIKNRPIYKNQETDCYGSDKRSQIEKPKKKEITITETRKN